MAEEIFTGVVTNLVGNQIYFKTKSAASYRAETGSASMARKNGAAMEFGEVAVGDRVEVKGRLWPDNSMNASFVRDLSLYVHDSTFKGKIISINPQELSVVISSKQYGAQTIRTDKYTEFKKNKLPATFRDLELGMSVAAKGKWERSSTIVAASSVSASRRMLNIAVTGELKMTGPAAFTVVGDNQVIYGVDITDARLKRKNGKPAVLKDFVPGNRVRVTGKHASEDVRVYAGEVKNLSH